MSPVISTHVLVLLAAFAVGYACWVAYWFISENRRSRSGRRTDNESHLPKPGKRDGEIIGKSLFVLPPRHSQTQAAIEPETVGRDENADNFAPASVPEHPRQIPADELDNVFGEAPEGEPNPPLDINYDPADEWPSDDDEHEDEPEPLPTRGASFAQGVRYEDMGEAYRHMVHDTPLTDDQKEKTGHTLLQMKGTEIYSVILSRKPEWENKAQSLIDTYLSAFRRQAAERSAGSPAPQSVPPGFSAYNHVKTTKR